MVRPLPRAKENIQSVIRAKTSGNWSRALFGKAVYFPGGHNGPRIQNSFQLVVLLGGSLRVTVEETPHELAPGDALLLHPGRREYFQFSATRESEHSWCQVAPGCLSRGDKRLLATAEGVRKAPSAVHVLIEEGLSTGHDEEAALGEAMLAMGRACLLRFAAEVRLLDRRESAPPHPALERAQEVAEVHFAELHSAEELARRVGVSVSQLRALCRQAGRESPSDMIWRLKAEHAIQMLRSTGFTLGEISEACGYANPFHLSRSVKARTGLSPRHLRRGEWNH